jgi:hypothetical protein|tara:strand:+ start:3451 stop:3681 length:231 start_codon:yes stop_codon:yes gene_type:complete
MAFEWHRIHKHEEQIENDIFDRVSEQVREHYEIEDVLDLTKDQIAEIEHFMEEYIGEYSVMRSGFADLFNHLENNE